MKAKFVSLDCIEAEAETSEEELLLEQLAKKMNFSNDAIIEFNVTVKCKADETGPGYIRLLHNPTFSIEEKC